MEWKNLYKRFKINKENIAIFSGKGSVSTLK